MRHRRYLRMAADALYDLEVDPGSIKASQLIDNRSKDRECETPPPEISNAMEFIQWLNDKKYIARGGSKAQRHVRSLMAAVNDIARAAVTAIKEQAEAVKDETYQDWRETLTVIGGIPSVKK